MEKSLAEVLALRAVDELGHVRVAVGGREGQPGRQVAVAAPAEHRVRSRAASVLPLVRGSACAGRLGGAPLVEGEIGERHGGSVPSGLAWIPRSTNGAPAAVVARVGSGGMAGVGRYGKAGAARYDEVADFYAAGWTDDLDDPASRRLLDLVEPVGGRRVLEIACGHGRISRALARRGAQVVGADISAALIAKAEAAERESPLGIRYLHADVTTGPAAPDRPSADVAAGSAALDRPALTCGGSGRSMSWSAASDCPTSTTWTAPWPPPPPCCVLAASSPARSCTLLSGRAGRLGVVAGGCALPRRGVVAGGR
ncbi:hypothetical protein GCM10020220_016760 [Nonomuraea rubra]